MSLGQDVGSFAGYSENLTPHILEVAALQDFVEESEYRGFSPDCGQSLVLPDTVLTQVLFECVAHCVSVVTHVVEEADNEHLIVIELHQDIWHRKNV